MKTMRFLFAVVGLGVLAHGLSFAGEPSGKTATLKPATGGSSALAQGSPAVPIVNTQPKSTLANNPSQPGLNQTRTAAKGGLMMNRTGAQRAAPTGMPFGSGSTVRLTGVVPSRGAAAPIIGGLATSSAKHSVAVINGIAMKRKP